MVIYMCSRHFCLAILVLLRSIGAVDVFVNRVSNYDGINILCKRTYLTTWIRHEPAAGTLVTRVLNGDNIKDQILPASVPYLDVLIHGTTKYFKIENTDWSSSTPFIGNKYYYYRVEDNEIAACEGLEYMRIYRGTFYSNLTLHLWRGKKYVYRFTSLQGRHSVADEDAFVTRVCAHNHTLWKYEEDKGITLVQVVNRKLYLRTLATLYFRDLNDNEIRMRFILGYYYASYFIPWKGYPKEYDAPREKLPAAYVNMEPDPIELIVNVTRDITNATFLKVRRLDHGNCCDLVYITHSYAHIGKFISPALKINLQDKKPFLAVYRVGGNSAKLQVLVYESETTKLFEITSDDMEKGLTEVTDPSIIIHSFPLYTEAEVDERMYTKRDITIGGVESVVYTARPHVAFTQIYSAGKPVFADGGLKVPINHYIL